MFHQYITTLILDYKLPNQHWSGTIIINWFWQSNLTVNWDDELLGWDQTHVTATALVMNVLFVIPLDLRASKSFTVLATVSTLLLERPWIRRLKPKPKGERNSSQAQELINLSISVTVVQTLEPPRSECSCWLSIEKGKSYVDTFTQYATQGG